MTYRTKALLALLLIATLWASAGSSGKLLFAYAPPFVIAFYRFSLASMIMFPFFIKTKKQKNFLKNLLPLGVFNGFNILFYYSGLSLTTANAAAILSTTVPLITAVFSRIFIKETVTKQKFIGICIGLIGTLLVVLIPLLEHNNKLGNIYGNILLICSIISWTFYVINSRSIMSQNLYSSVLATSINFFTVTVFSAAAVIISGESFILPHAISPIFLVTLFYSVLGITVITFFLFQWALQYLSATTVSLKDYLQLVLAIGMNSYFLGEKLTVSYFIGSILVISGIFIATGGRIIEKLRTYLVRINV